MEKLPDRYRCERCGHITTRNVTTCPACGDGKWEKSWEYTKKPGDKITFP